jgi:hypothetical protein
VIKDARCVVLALLEGFLDKYKSRWRHNQSSRLGGLDAEVVGACFRGYQAEQMQKALAQTARERDAQLGDLSGHSKAHKVHR